MWFTGGQRYVTSPGRAMLQPYPRIIVLHVSVLIAFAVTLQQLDGGSAVPASLQPLLTWLDTWAGQDVWLVLVLITLKTAADIWTTRRATRI